MNKNNKINEGVLTESYSSVVRALSDAKHIIVNKYQKLGYANNDDVQSALEDVVKSIDKAIQKSLDKHYEDLKEYFNELKSRKPTARKTVRKTARRTVRRY